MDTVTGAILISLMFSAFFSGIEIAFVSSDPLHLKIQSTKGHIYSRILNFFIHKPSIFITTALVGNTIALVFYGTYMAKFLDPFIHTYISSNYAVIMLLETIFSTIVVLLTAEFLPKSLFMISPNKMLSFFAIPMFIIIVPLYIPVWIIVQLSKLIIKYGFSGEYSEEKPIYGLTDLNNFIQKIAEGKGSSDSKEIPEVDSEIFSNAIDFKKVKVRDCLIPRTEIVAVEYDEGIEGLKSAFIESGHSKVFVYKESIDEIKGYCHSSSLFKKPKNINEIINDLLIVPETKMAHDLMIELITKHRSIALVVDEYGGTSGVVTIEDIIEEIFGEIQDEHDDEDLIQHKINENNFVLSGRHEIDYLNETFKIGLPEGEYDTLSGLILSEYGEIPRVGSVIEIAPFSFIVKQMEGLKIERVHLKIEKLSEEE